MTAKRKNCGEPRIMLWTSSLSLSLCLCMCIADFHSTNENECLNTRHCRNNEIECKSMPYFNSNNNLTQCFQTCDISSIRFFMYTYTGVSLFFYTFFFVFFIFSLFAAFVSLAVCRMYSYLFGFIIVSSVLLCLIVDCLYYNVIVNRLTPTDLFTVYQCR